MRVLQSAVNSSFAWQGLDLETRCVTRNQHRPITEGGHAAENEVSGTGLVTRHGAEKNVRWTFPEAETTVIAVMLTLVTFTGTNVTKDFRDTDNRPPYPPPVHAPMIRW